MPATDKDLSKIKMVVLTSGKNDNITWYSILGKDDQQIEKIINSMLRRFNEHCNKNITIKATINKINFYDNQTKAFLGEATIT